MNRESELFEACRILFGSDIQPSSGFLNYLREEGITAAFRKRAMEIHPDKALLSGFSLKKCQEEFILLQSACQTLRQHIGTRNIKVLKKQFNTGQKKTTLYNVSLPDRELLFGRFLYHGGIIQWRQLIQALAWQKSGRLKIGELGVSLGYLDRNSVGIILNHSKRKRTFGLTAWKLGLLTRAEVRYLLLRQKRQQKKIGQFFVENGVLNNLELGILLRKCKQHNSQIKTIAEK